jgi:ribosomal protein S18 acetylase RimI-like enzyme
MRIRPARPGDLEFVHDLAPRLVEFGDVPGRDSAQMTARDREVLARTLDDPSPGASLFIAEDDQGQPVGFVHLTTAADYYTAATTAHVADLVVAPGSGGRGVGTALIEHAEAWARERGFSMLTLSVFTGNERARRLYRRLGFVEEWIRCIKRL